MLCPLRKRYRRILASFIILVLLGLSGFFVHPSSAQPSAPEGEWDQIASGDLALGPPLSLGFDDAGAVWVGAPGGVNILDPDGVERTIILPDAEVGVADVSTAQDGTVWLATDSSSPRSLGVIALSADGERKEYQILDGLSDNHVRKIAFDRLGGVWFATANGLGYLAPDGGWSRYTRAVGLSDDNVYALEFDEEDNLWIGTYNGLNRLSADGKWESYAVAQSPASQWVRDIVVDREGRVWCATALGLSVRTREGIWTTLTASDGLASSVLHAIELDGQGGIWVGTTSGVSYVLVADNDDLQVIDVQTDLPGSNILDIEFGPDGRLWFATDGGLGVMTGALSPNIPTPEPSPTRTLAPPSPVSTATSEMPAVEGTAAALPAGGGLGTPEARVTPPATIGVTGGDVSGRAIMLGGIAMPGWAIYVFYAAAALVAVITILVLRHLFVRARRRRTEPPLRADSGTIGSEDVMAPTGTGISEASEAIEQVPGASEQSGAIADEVVEDEAAEQVTGSSAMVADSEGEEQPLALDDARFSVTGAAVSEPDNGDVDELMQRGVELAHQGRQVEAYDLFSEVTRQEPGHVEAWMWKGAVSLHPEDSVRCLRKALELDPDNPRVRRGLEWAQGQLAQKDGGEPA